MKKVLLLIGIIFSAFLLSGCNLSKNAIIKVNDEVITKEQYDAAFNTAVSNSALAQYGIDLKSDPDNYIHLALKQRVVSDLIIKKLLEQEIKSRKIKVTQEDLDKEYNTLIEKIGSKEKFDEILKQSKLSQTDFKKDLKEEVKLQKLISTLSVIKVSDADVEKYYKNNINSFKYPDKVKSSHIMISADPIQIKDLLLAKKENKNLSHEELSKKINEEIAAKKKKAEAVLAKLKIDKNQFAQLAKENSDDVISATDGGNLGFLTKEELPAEYAKVAFAQKPNTVSNIVTTPYGFEIIMVTDRMKAGVEPFEKVKFELKNYLEQQEKTQVLQKFVENIKAKATIEYIDSSYNPEEIDKKLREAQQKNPSLIGAQSATE